MRIWWRPSPWAMIWGHTPFGHAGEAALNEVCPEGFAHYKQEPPSRRDTGEEWTGPDLTWEVRDGILNHRTAGRPSTLEGQIVRLCDKISYIHHDMDDAERAGIISEDDIPITLRVVLGGTTRERLNTLIHDIVANSYGKDQIIQSEEIHEAMMTLRKLMFDNVYTNPMAKHEEIKAKRMLQELYDSEIARRGNTRS